VDVNSSTCETASVASDDINGSVVDGLGNINDQLGDSLLREDSASSDVEDTNGDNEQGSNN